GAGLKLDAGRISAKADRARARCRYRAPRPPEPHPHAHPRRTAKYARPARQALPGAGFGVTRAPGVLKVQPPAAVRDACLGSCYVITIGLTVLGPLDDRSQLAEQATQLVGPGAPGRLFDGAAERRNGVEAERGARPLHAVGRDADRFV